MIASGQSRKLAIDFLVFLETSEVAGPGPNPREIDISFGAQWALCSGKPEETTNSKHPMLSPVSRV